MFYFGFDPEEGFSPSVRIVPLASVRFIHRFLLDHWQIIDYLFANCVAEARGYPLTPTALATGTFVPFWDSACRTRDLAILLALTVLVLLRHLHHGENCSLDATVYSLFKMRA